MLCLKPVPYAIMVFVIIFSVCGALMYINHSTEASASLTASPQSLYEGIRFPSIENVPSTVSIQYEGNHVCSGSIIGPRFILTTALCFERRNHSGFSVRVGSANRSQGGTVLPVDEIIIHEHFHHLPHKDGLVTMHDIAIVALRDVIEYNERQNKIDMNGDLQLTEGEVTGTVNGWNLGKLGRSDMLTLVVIPIENPVMCNTAYKDYALVEDGMLCAGFYGFNKKTSCPRDLGAPLIAKKSLVGMWSWGSKCGKDFYPGVYTNVAFYRLWIRKVIGL